MKLRQLLSLEATKMTRQRLSQVTLFVPLALAASLPQLFWLLESIAPEGGFEVLTRTFELTLLLACYLLLLQSAASVAGEYQDGTLRNLLVTPARRSEIVLARWIALSVTALIVLVTVSIVAAASTALHFSFDDVYEEAIEPLAEASELRDFSVVSILHLILPLCALVSFGLCLSFFSSAPAPAAAAALGGLLILDIVKSILPAGSAARRYLVNSYLPTLFDETSYLQGTAAYARGFADRLWLPDAPEHSFAVMVPVATAVLFVGVSLLLFSRRSFVK